MPIIKTFTMLFQTLHQLKYFALTLVFFLMSNTYSQNKNSELLNTYTFLMNSINSSSDCNSYLNINQTFYEGKVILKDSSTLKGKISVNQLFENKLITILNTDNEYQPINNQKIKEVVLFHEDGKISKFLNLNKDERLYRLVFKKNNKVSLYDSSDEPNNTHP